MIKTINDLGFDVCLSDRESKRIHKGDFDYYIFTNSKFINDNLSVKNTIFYSCEPCSDQRVAAEKREIELAANTWGIRRTSLRSADNNDSIAARMAQHSIVTGYTWSAETFDLPQEQVSQIPITIPYANLTNCRLYPARYSSKSVVWIGAGGWLLKGFNDVLELASANPDYKFYVIGTIEPVIEEKDFEKKIPNLTFVGYLQPWSSEFQAIMDESSIALCTSRSESGYGSGLACLIYGCYPIFSKESSFHKKVRGSVIGHNETLLEVFKRTQEIEPHKKAEAAQENVEFVRRAYSNSAYAEVLKSILERQLK
jgi:hypothetical protein